MSERCTCIVRQGKRRCRLETWEKFAKPNSAMEPEAAAIVARALRALQLGCRERNGKPIRRDA